MQLARLPVSQFPPPYETRKKLSVWLELQSFSELQ